MKEAHSYNDARRMRLENVKDPQERTFVWLREVAEEITRLRFELRAQRDHEAKE